MGLWCHGLLQNINVWTNCIFKEYCQFQFMYFTTVCSNQGAWGSVVVKALRY